LAIFSLKGGPKGEHISIVGESWLWKKKHTAQNLFTAFSNHKKGDIFWGEKQVCGPAL